MPDQPDIFGLAFLDYLQGQTQEHILVKINISEPEELPVSYFFRNYKQMPAWEKLVMKQCSGRVLDAGAGAGTHALYLQNRGMDVTAIDLSPGAVACMQQRGIKKAFHADFLSFQNGQFDTILFLMNGAGMAQYLNQLAPLLRHAKSLLSPKGSIFVESTDLLYMYEDEEDGSVAINLAGNYYGEIVYQLEYKQWIGKPFDWLFVDFENLADAADLVGLDCQMIYEGKTDNFIARLQHKP